MKIIEPKYKQIYDRDELDTFINKSIAQLRNDEPVYSEIKKMKVNQKTVRNFLGQFLDFQDDFNYCKNCPGLDKCAKQTKHMQLTLSYEDDHIDRHLSLCPLLLARIKQDKMYLVNDFPLELRSLTSNDIIPLQSRNEILDKMQRVINDDAKDWIYLFGQHGIGKSFLTIVCINSLVSKNKGPIAFLDCCTRLKELVDSSFDDKQTFQEKMDLYSNIPVLVLDGFGDEYRNDYLRDMIVNPLLLARRKNNLLTIFTSNFSLDDIEKLYSGKSKNGAIIAHQMCSIIKEQCGTPIALNGKPIFK